MQHHWVSSIVGSCIDADVVDVATGHMRKADEVARDELVTGDRGRVAVFDDGVRCAHSCRKRLCELVIRQDDQAGAVQSRWRFSAPYVGCAQVRAGLREQRAVPGGR